MPRTAHSGGLADHPDPRVLARGDRLVVADRTTLRLLDAAGAEVATCRTEEQDLSFGAGVFLAAESGDLFCFFGSAACRSGAQGMGTLTATGAVVRDVVWLTIVQPVRDGVPRRAGWPSGWPRSWRRFWPCTACSP